MSRKAPPGARSTTITTTPSLPSLGPDEMCPVCKTMRYLNKEMKFLINPECYHSMCSACVDRLFNSGPNQCPHAGCHKTLRRKGFRAAFFGDLAVEREVDIRRRVAAVFNQKEEDFIDLQAYNDYLQKVEDLTFDLVNGNDTQRQAAEAELQEWEAEHKAEIERNKKAGREADEQSRRRLAAEREAARQRRLDAVREAEEEKQERARNREAELDSLAKGESASSRVQLKRRGQANRAAEAAANATATASSVAGASDAGRLSIRGLKEKKKAPAPDGPYDPFGGPVFVPSRYTVHSKLTHPKLEGLKNETLWRAGGYSFEDYTAQAMFEAFSGLGVFIEDEKEAGIGLSAGDVVGMAAGIAAVGDKMDLD
ncbi:RNA polymerase II transcription factor B subunit 3 [Podospora fimiseda]|uniref:RNA polymerase II transcription factor B subunit 3 n=1 Tax=Podospora fimiseda TaxID=252190 RepID=A0AAN7H325_9PEZI|nr:RNA polymerase II transcription factor B subunit 3 [Podospora fimiseda]